MKFNYLNVFQPNKHTEDYHIKKPNNEKFLFEIGDEEYIYVGEKIVSFETKGIIVKYSSDHGLSDIKFTYAYGEENIYFMLHQKHIPIQDYETSTEKNEYEYLFKLKKNGIDGIVESGNDFTNCKTVQSKQQ